MERMSILFFCLVCNINLVWSLESYRIFVSSLTPESDVRVGAKGEGISAFDLIELANGSISFTPINQVLNVSSAINIDLTHNGKYLYAITFGGDMVESQIHAFRISEKAKARPAVIGSWPVGQIEPIELTIDADDRFAFIAMYNGNAASAYQIDPETGGLYMRNFFEFPNPTNITHDAGPHFSIVDKKMRFVYFGGLQHDCIWRFNYSYQTGFDSSSLKIYPAPIGSGPRSMIFHPANESYLYVSCEKTNHIIVYKVDANGDLTQLQYEPMTTANATQGSRMSDIKISPDARFLYTLTRYGPNTIATYQVSADGSSVKMIQEISTGGVAPNHVSLIPKLNLVLVSNQDSDTITAFRSSTENGTLTKINQWTVMAPECMQVMVQPTGRPSHGRGHGHGGKHGRDEDDD